MPSGKCRTCGRMTNSVTSNWWKVVPRSYYDNYPKEEGFATECYLAWDENVPVRGCAYNKCSGYMKQYVDNLIKKVKSG